MRVKITLRCNECKQRNYNTVKNKKNDPDRLEMNKYCPFCRKHTVHNETKSVSSEKESRVSNMAENEKMEQTQAASEKAPKAQKDKKSEKKSKPSTFDRIGRWLRELKSELKKVQWPSKKQTMNNTVIVIACVLVVGVFIWLFDFVAGGLINTLINLVG